MSTYEEDEMSDYIESAKRILSSHDDVKTAHIILASAMSISDKLDAITTKLEMLQR